MAESIAQRLSKVPDKLTDTEIRAVLIALLADVTALKTAINAHTHGGVTVGAGTTGVANAATMGSLTTTA